MNAQGTERTEKRLCVGLLAHVDAGKTTLSEAMLYRAGVIRTFGSVDHGDTFLDTDAQERSRGITIFSKQAVLPLPGCTLTLLDTPGHVDFSAEMERTLQVLEPVMKRRIPRYYLLTRFDRRRRMSDDIRNKLRERYGDDVLETVISENVAVAESPSLNQDVFRHSPSSPGAHDHRKLLDELVDRGDLPVTVKPAATADS